MKIKINAVSVDLTKHVPVLSKYKFEGSKQIGTIEIETLQDIFKLSEELNNDLILDKDFSVTIFDDYL